MNDYYTRTSPTNAARRFSVRGIVQGVGFRPRVARLAVSLGITGCVHNAGTSVSISAYGTPSQLARFESLLRELKGAGLRIDAIDAEPLTPEGSVPAHFGIARSEAATAALGVGPDLATCPACLAEVLDPQSRRYRYPFNACTDCGPRLSVFRKPPYDRAHTSMAAFSLCDACAREYATPHDRRFHAQATSCPVCGPEVRLVRLDGQALGSELSEALDDIDAAAMLISRGEIVLIKGLGGYQLACDATNADAVSRLRALKARESKPFALLARDLTMARQWCEIDEHAAAALTSAAAPIVLVAKRHATPRALPVLAPGIAPGLAELGVMLPPTALHLLLLLGNQTPIVLTSGNLCGEPQAVTFEEATTRLGAGLTYVLDHNRAIERRVDDSVGRVVGGRFRVMRRSRGYAPAPITLPRGFEPATQALAVGGDLKNTFALVRDGEAVLAQHIGDLHNAACQADQQRAITDYMHFYRFEPRIIACDCHHGYAATQNGHQHYADRYVAIGHHHAHVAACLGEYGWPLDAGPLIGVTLDGIGLGHDGELWGGEFLLADYRQCRRIGTLKPIALPGGDAAAREPWRNLYAQLMMAFGWAHLAAHYSDLELFSCLAGKPRATLDAMLCNRNLAPLASSAGRLFDAVAAALGLCCDRVTHEGQAAMQLEACVRASDLLESETHAYPFAVGRLDDEQGLPYIEPRPMWKALLDDLRRRTPHARIAARFHRGFARAVVGMAVQLAQAHGVGTIALGGGVFQNRILSEHVLDGLRDAGLQALLPEQIPTNDGGLAWGQALIALASQRGPISNDDRMTNHVPRDTWSD
ncbi:Carbamoyltransferase HypF [Paraburkholderia ribeironis]|uniref:Carbamoyltransferase HypF n=1 Tax=Paraburkholderia ribeironis TaxID=1247936 RepID=A0A1N7RSX8_9BURK|nr:carbamoyltransferase HypF [Paraburkholderia ribeironis]SIT38224.1 Carbamoyltransferase HypF [Paraburkholderia ribeironis]